MNKPKFIRDTKDFFSIAVILIIVVFFITFVFSAYFSNTGTLSDRLDQRQRSVANINEMEQLLYMQSMLISQYVVGLDPNSTVPASFQSYVSAFQTHYKQEYDKASVVEEINYTYQINSNYNEYIDMFSTLQRYDLSNSAEYEDAYLYYRLTIVPQITEVYSALKNYRLYLETSISSNLAEIKEYSKQTIMILSIAFLIIILIVYLFYKHSIKNQLQPLYGAIEERQKFEKTKSDFFSTISHEFKTPLTSIIMGTDLLQSDAVGELNETQSELVATIKEDSFLLTHLINNLLQLSRTSSDEVNYTFEIAEINDIVSEASTQFHQMADKYRIHLNFNPTENLPKVNVDTQKIIWVINNILSNAFKYSKEGDLVEIKTIESSGQYISVSISDQGPGIPAEYTEKIFEKYFQVNEGDIELGGTGLGLAISKDIIKAHGGDIWYTDNTPRGSIFTFTIPLLNTPKIGL